MGFVGVETEFGIAVTGPEDVHPARASALVVAAHRDLVGGGVADVGWDFTAEQPERDARATPVRPDPPELTLGEAGTTNLVLTNGARLYVDHAHPEYATPECRTAEDLVVWDVAGERILEAAARRAEAALPAGSTVHVHKNNTDGKGAAYGTHENYLVDRAVPFGLLTRQLLPMFVSRAVLVGAGRVGSEHVGGLPFQLSQRADFFETDIGLETTVRRPLMNTRDEPHADPDRHRRLHVITGDANLVEEATFVKVASMLLLLAAVEAGDLPAPTELADPVDAMRTLSHDPELRARVATTDGRRLGAVDLQEELLARVDAALPDDARDAGAARALETWAALLAAAREGPAALFGRTDWATKLQLVDGFRARHDLAADDPRVRMIDLQYHDVRRDKGLYHRLVAAGRIARRTDEAAVVAAMTAPPEDTRAWLRGACVRALPSAVVAAGWDSVVLDRGGGRGLVRLPLADPAAGTRRLTEAALRDAEDVDDLLRRLGAPTELPGQLA